MAKANLTSAGLLLLTNAQGGNDTITFTRMAIGDGKLGDTPISTLTTLVSQKAEMPITQKKIVKTGTYQIGAYFSNADITVGFYWRETGIFAKGNDGKEILYCYVNVGDVTDYISVATDKRIEKYIYQSLTVDNSTNISIQVNESEMMLTEADKGASGGVAPLDESGKVPNEYLPDMDYVATSTFNEFKEGINTEITKANDAIADAKSAGTTAQSNLNAHTSNKSNPHGVTAEQVGAIANTKHIDGKDIMSIVDEGSYYCTNAINAPTENNRSGYLKIVAITDTYRVVSWRANNSLTEYVNVLSNGTWLGWTETFTNKGGLLNGDLKVFKEYPQFTLNNNNKSYALICKNSNDEIDSGLLIRDSSNNPQDDDNYLEIELKHAFTKNGNANQAFRLHHRENGNSYVYPIFGEHNKPTQDYNGTAAAQTVNVGGIGNVVMIYSHTSNYLSFLTPSGGFSFYTGGNNIIYSITPAQAYFADGVLHINTNVSYINTSGVEYFCKVL